MNLAHWAFTSSFLKCSYCSSSSMCRQWGYLQGVESQSRGQLTEGFTNITTLSSKRKSSKLRIKHVAILEELGILRLLPVQQVLQVVDEGSVPQDASLSQNWKQTHKTYVKLWQMWSCEFLITESLTVQVVGIRQTLDELELQLETVPGLLVCTGKHTS